MSQCLEPSEYKVVSHLYDNGDSWEKCAAGARIFQKLKSAAWNSEVAPVSDYRIQVQENLPALAWICEIKNGSHVFTIGPRVEHGKDFIVEGAWDGDFQKGDFASSDHFYGSGAILEPENCIFVPPRLCTDYLFALHDADRATTWVSNSFNFLLARADINQNSVFYRTFAANLNKSTNEESALGADRGSPLIARSGSLSIYRFMYHNFSIDGEGNIQYLMRLPANPCIKDFLSYKNFLNDKVSLLLTNSVDPARKNPMGAISMLSTGYDSCAASAVASQCGVKDAITLDVRVGGHNDCGEAIAAALGMSCQKVKSPLGAVVPILKAQIAPEASLYLEFLATPGIGDNVAFLGMEPFLGGKLVFSGLYGDGCWARSGCGSGLAHHLPYMKSRMEFRLRVGYCLVPVPAFGAYFSCFLNKISNSPELEPWALNNNYDRPIPRRLAEGAGVPRHFFGMRKAANNPDIINWRELFDPAVKYVMTRYRQ